MNQTPPARQHLAIDKASVVIRVKTAFSIWSLKITPHMPRTSRYTLGARIETHFLDLLEIIYQAYYASLDKKSEKIVLAISKNDLLKYLLQIAWENKLIKDAAYAELVEKLGEIGRILGGWKKGVETKTPPR